MISVNNTSSEKECQEFIEKMEETLGALEDIPRAPIENVFFYQMIRLYDKHPCVREFLKVATCFANRALKIEGCWPIHQIQKALELATTLLGKDQKPAKIFTKKVQ